MSTGAQVNTITIRLQGLLQEIQRATLKLLAKGKRPSVTDPADAAYFDQLDSWKTRLEGSKQWLGRLGANLESQRTIELIPARGASAEAKRSEAYRARQSLDDQSRSVDKAQALAREIADQLSDLLLLSLAPTKADFERMTASLIKQPVDFLQKLEKLETELLVRGKSLSLDQGEAKALRSTLGDARTQFFTAPKPAAPDHLGAVAIMLTLLRVLWLQRIRRSDDKAAR